MLSCKKEINYLVLQLNCINVLSTIRPDIGGLDNSSELQVESGNYLWVFISVMETI